MEKMCFKAILPDFPRKSLFSKENHGWRKSIVLENDKQKDGGKKYEKICEKIRRKTWFVSFFAPIFMLVHRAKP
jgi:hypothetical protein